ncbi:transcriptional regulator, MerR family [Desulfatibacillum aliphaticivorans]|uniref:Transcriptional regulator, MerR family n=1 Tax=Desulfatibacillum aliphaticivorans TaxID=218208 RepID=B8FFU5_DESAL|nr:MerR family transcriptional regulator [Desulfatibacillum aliphaticivorans]ACL03500.1 transcriptional regulator, MerR family [Desulfatibacillum aliphaticivorans]
MSEEFVLDPDKRYFRIGEVSSIAGLKPSVLRFWESEFKQIRPGRSLSGHRVYKRTDLDLILRIKDLLYTQKFTIPGAKAALAQEGKQAKEVKESSAGEKSAPGLEEIRDELLAIRRMLD